MTFLRWRTRGPRARAPYWSPVPSISATGYGQHRPEGSGGGWQERNWRNVPGPIYGAVTDNCWVARTEAPHHALYGGEDYREYCFRQPRDEEETLALLRGAAQDPYDGWGVDGDEYWTPELVRVWWQNRAALVADLEADLVRFADSSIPEEIDLRAGLREYLDYIAGDLERALRGYVFWLMHGRAPSLGEELPPL